MIPLHRLPKRSLDIVLRNMTTMNQFLLSLYYERFESRIKKLNIGIGTELRIVIKQYFSMYIYGPNTAFLGFTFHFNEPDSPRKEGEPKRSFSENDLVDIVYIDDDWEYGWRFDFKKSARQWISLVMEVFNLNKIKDLEYKTDDYCFDSVKEMLRGIQLERLEITGDEAMSEYQEILKALPPSDSFVVPGSIQVEKLQNVLLQNFESISLSFQLKFDDLLIVNSKLAYICGKTFTIKNLNEFLKLWRKGSNPNARHFSIRGAPIPDNDYVMNVLKGIPYETVPRTVERSFPTSRSSLPVKYERIQGGYDIKRMTDGRKQLLNSIPFGDHSHFISLFGKNKFM